MGSAKTPGAKKTPLATRVFDRIERTLDAYLADPEAATRKAAEKAIPDASAQQLETILGGQATSYRDATIIQLAFGLEDSTSATRHTTRGAGARSIAGRLGKLLATRHIRGVRDAYQNIGKNTDKLDRGNVPDFDQFLKSMDAAAASVREAAFEYVVARVSMTARLVLPMPSIDRASLTFRRCAIFLAELMKNPSGGAYQQFAVAAFLHAIIDEFGQGGPGGLRVETKNLTASDKASSVVGDVQIVRGNRVEEAFEVTANDWRTKIDGAVQTIRAADLQRAHVIAAVEDTFPSASEDLDRPGMDITVIDTTAYLRTLIAVMRKPARETALQRLYELLDRHQPHIERTNLYVKLLREHGMTLGPVNG
jgi:hypothetical protein